MSGHPFDPLDVIRWNDIFNAQTPEKPTTVEILSAPDVVSFCSLAKPNGFCIRIGLSDGSEQTLNLNPLICQYLITVIASGGHAAGWMNRDGSIAVLDAPS